MKKYFEELTDVRRKNQIDYSLHEILIMTIWAMICDIHHWEEIADFAKTNVDWFRKHAGLTLETGVPSHDTFQRVFQIMNPEELEQCFMNWTNSLATKNEGDLVSLDGKTICGSRDAKTKALHLVSAWSNANQMTLGQIKVDEKSNEIKALPELLKLLDLEGCIVTIDAMGTQKEIAKLIAPKNDYVLALKGNHGNLHEDVSFYMQQETIADKLKQVDANGSRIEIREYFLETDIDWLDAREQWLGMQSIGMVRSTVTKGEKTTIEDRYFISTLTDVKDFAGAVRGHWGIENSLHWRLDVIFKEDASRTRVGHSGHNLAVIRKIAGNILVPHPLKKSLNFKRKKCLYDLDFRNEILDLISNQASATK